MAAKKPSAVTQLKALKVEHAALQQQTQKLEKEVEKHKQSYDYAHKARDAAQSELDQAHSLLDVLPGVGRKSEHGEYGGCTTYTLATRIAAFLAKRE